jgi:TP901 family phage tail tape measure protein
MAAESNVGLRLLLIGKDGILTGLREVQAAVRTTNADIAAGGKASKVAAAGYAEQEAGLVSLGAKMDIYEASLARTAAQTDAVARLGKVAFFTIAAAAATAGYESIKWATQYQNALTRLSTQAGQTASAVASIGSAAMKNAAYLNVSPAAYLQAAYHPASTGFSPANTIAITNAAIKLADIGGASPEDTVNTVTGLARIYGLSKKTPASSYADFANAMIGAGNLTATGLNSAIGTGAFETAKSFGVSKESMGGLIAYLTDRTIGPAQAGTRARMFVSLLGAPSAAAIKAETAAGMSQTSAKNLRSSVYSQLTSMGLTTTDMQYALHDNKGGGGIVNAMKLLKSHMSASGMDQEAQGAFIAKIFGGARTGSTAETAYENLGGLSQKTGQILKNEGAKKSMEDWIKYTQTLDYQVGRLGKTFETMGTEFGTLIRGPLKDGVKDLTDLLGIFDKNKWAVGALGGAITLVLVPAIGVYLKRALLSEKGALMTVVDWYKKLIASQLAQRTSLGETDAALGANDAALATNTGDLAVNDAASVAKSGGAVAGLLGFLGGKGGTAVGVALSALGIHELGQHANKVLNHQKVPSIQSWKALEERIGNVKAQMNNAEGGGGIGGAMGKVESWGLFGDLGRWATAEHIPGLQSNTAGIVAQDKVQLSQYEAQLKEMQKKNPSQWSKIDGQEIHLQSTINLNVDGKKLAAVVTKQTKKNASRN